MDLQARKITFVQEFLRLENEEIVNGLEDLLRKKKAEHYKQQLKPMSADQGINLYPEGFSTCFQIRRAYRYFLIETAGTQG